MQPYGPNPYAPPQRPFGPPPQVPQTSPTTTWRWYVAYAVFMSIVYALFAAVCAFMLVFEDSIPSDPREATPEITAFIGIGLGLPLMVAFAVAPFLPKRPWAWTYHLVLVCLTMTSLCCMPFGLPLVLRWNKPETKAMFGKT